MDQERMNHFCGNGKIWRVGGIALALLSLFLFSKTITEIKSWGFVGKSVSPLATISVSGKGEILVKPDIATFSFGIQEESLVVGTAQGKVAKSENAILDFLKKGGVAADDIKVSDYNIYPRYDYVRYGADVYGGGKQVLAAYVVSESVEVKVRDISSAGKLIGSMGELGATNLSGLTFSVDKQDDVLKEARGKAIADAKVNAEKLASELGVSLGKIVSFSDSNSNPPGPIYYTKAMDVASASGAAPALPSGTNKITSNVSVTYEIR